MAEEKVLVRFGADITELKTQLLALESEMNKVAGAEKKIDDEIKAGSLQAATASQKRVIALKNEEAELKRLQAGIKQAFTVKDIESFNSRIAQTKNNIATLKGEAGGLGKITGGLKTQFAALGAGIAAAFTVDAVIEFGKASVQAFLEADENAQRLKNSLNEVGDEGNKAFDRLIKQSESLAQTGVTIFTDDDIQRAQAQLANFGLTANEIERLIPKLADYASATKQNIVDASAKVGNALLGQGKEFKKYGIIVDASKTSQENYNTIIEGFVKFQGRAAKETQTLTGQLADQKREVDELQESIGSKLAPAWVSAKAAGLGFVNSILNIFSTTGELKKQLKDLGLTATETAAILQATGGDIDTSKSGTKAINNFKSLLRAVNDYNFALTNSKQPNIDYLLIIERLNTLITKQNTGTLEGQQSINLLKNAITQITDTYKGMQEPLRNTIDLTKKSTEELIKLKEASTDDRDLTILIDRELAARKKKADALAKELEAQKKAAEELKKIRDEEQKEINRRAGVVKDFNDQIQQDATKQVIENTKELDKANKELLNQHVEDKKIETALLLEQDKIYQEEKEKLEKEAEAKRKERRDTAQREAISLAQTIVDATFQIQRDDTKRKFDAQEDALAEQKSKELSNKRLTEAQKERINKEYAQKERELAKKRFDENKQLAISEAVIKGALAVINAIATADDIYVGLILAASVAAETAVQVALIQSQKFAKGTKGNKKEGMALVGEEGPEFMFVPQGAKIMTAKQTRQHGNLLDAMYDGALDKYIHQTYILPALQAQKEKASKQKDQSFADNMLKGLIFHGLTGNEMERIQRKGTQITNVDELVYKLAEALKQNHNPRRF